MFKRINKITALLVAAAAVVSIVPATGVSAAQRLGTKDGTIENAIAFKDGKYIYEGYRTEDDNKSVYYNDGGKDKELDDLTDAVLYETSATNQYGKYDTKNAIVWDGNDEYLVDLSNGKVSDEDLASDIASTSENKLKSKLKKTDRYDNNNVNIIDFKQITTDQFADVWYQYEATTSAGVAYGYADTTGKYVDASKVANLRVFNGSKIVKIDEFADDATDGIKADLVGAPVAIAQDKDYIYSVVTVNFTTEAGVTVYDSKGETAITTQKYLQKISKTQGDKEKDAYLPKTVESYDLTDTMSEGDIDTAYNKIMKAVAGSSDVVGVRVIDGILYYTEMDSSTNVKTYKIKFAKNLKLDTATAGKVDAYAMKKDGNKDQDVMGIEAVSIDIDGNVWALNKGEIMKSEKGGEFKTVYTCDRSLDALDVYDEGSMIAWDQSGDVYTTFTEGKAATDSEVTPAQTGWVNTATGWTFYDAAGKQVVGTWVNAGGVWYMIKADGIMATGWYNDNGTWYYLNASGAMQTGWFNSNGTWYYLQSSGAMKTGWLNDNGTWYYLQASGAMAANTTVDGYVLNASGAWVK